MKVAPLLIAVVAAQSIVGREPPASPDAPPCHLKVGVAIACGGSFGDDAAEAFSAYGLNRTLILEDYTQAVLAKAGCMRVIDPHNEIEFRARGSYTVATANGWVRVSSIDLSKQGYNLQWIAQPYFDRTCPRRPTLDAARETPQ